MNKKKEKKTAFRLKLDIRAFQELNVKRCESPGGFNMPIHRGIIMRDARDAFDFAALFSGEAGEIVNLLNKVRRGILTMDEARPALEREIADAFCYMCMLAESGEVDIPSAALKKFEEVSVLIGYDEEEWKPGPPKPPRAGLTYQCQWISEPDPNGNREIIEDFCESTEGPGFMVRRDPLTESEIAQIKRHRRVFQTIEGE